MTQTVSDAGSRNPVSDAIECGPLWVSPREFCEARVRGRAVRMSIGSLRVLANLLQAGGRIVSREVLAQTATDRPTRLADNSRAVDLRILRIRRSLGTLGRFVIAVPTLGYRIDVDGLSRAR